MRLELFPAFKTEQEAETIVGLATLTDDVPTGVYFHEERRREWPPREGSAARHPD